LRRCRPLSVVRTTKLFGLRLLSTIAHQVVAEWREPLKDSVVTP
jgi:hypothetical protein